MIGGAQGANNVSLHAKKSSLNITPGQCPQFISPGNLIESQEIYMKIDPKKNLNNSIATIQEEESASACRSQQRLNRQETQPCEIIGLPSEIC